MILIADSGSTKTEWALIKKDKSIIEFKTIGLNPVFVNSEIVISEITKTKLIDYSKNINEVYFYGAGCSTQNRKNVIKIALKELFPKAKISVESDLLGAAISQFGSNNGIIGILGTGSNTGIYKKGEIIENISSLGYILGDEGSGAVIGKAFIKLYLDNEISEKLANKFNKTFNLTIDNIITKVYKEPFPNRFLASFMPFIFENKSDKIIQKLLFNSFSDFFEKTICKYSNYKKYDVKLIGSIAHYFDDIIKDVCDIKKIKLIEISKSPLQGMIKFYNKN